MDKDRTNGNIDQLKFDDKNFNKHTEYGMSLLEKSLRENGAGRSILVDKDDNIIAGNGIVEAAINAGISKTRIVEVTGDELVVVKRTDLELDSKQGREMALADNATAAADLSWDEECIAAETEKWEIVPEDWGGELPETADGNGGGSSEDDFDESEVTEAVCKRGEVWKLGEHRLMCGDSTSADDVATLMQGEKADLWLTDPPYNVAIKNSQGMTIANDNMKNQEFHDFLTAAFAAAVSVLGAGCPFYIWFASREHINFETALKNAGLKVRQELIWNKSHFILGRGHYHWKHEPCLYGRKGENCKYFIGERNKSTIIQDAEELDIDRMKKDEMRDLLKKIFEERIPTTVIKEKTPQKDADHPTMKPVRLFGYLMENSSRGGGIVLDSFGGSGTTMIAAEQLNRKCRMMELDPHYCDVIIARWEKFTGQKAELIENGIR